ncbi:MAG: hypothetical protein AAFZ01_11345 [Pseudomonadota bacterium]
MRHVLGIFGLMAAGILLAVSAAMNWQFGAGLGTTTANASIFGFASASADVMKALLPFFIFAAWRQKSWSQVLAGGTLWGICLAFSLTSALGFSAMNRKDTASERQSQAVAYADIRTEMARQRERLSWIPQHRPAATVAAEMRQMEQNRRWRSSAGCTDATASKSIAFCQTYHGLSAEAAAGREAGKIESRIGELKTQLAATPRGVTSETLADPQSHFLGKLIGQDESLVQMGLIVLMALLVEFGSALGFYVVFSQWNIYADRMLVPAARPRTRTREIANDNRGLPAELPAQETPAPVIMPAATAAAVAAAAPKMSAVPDNDVERFYRDRVDAAEGCSLTATALYEEYCAWCDELSKEPMALPMFGRQFGELGVDKAKIAGRIRYIGIRLSGEAGGDAGEDKAAPLNVVAA